MLAFRVVCVDRCYGQAHGKIIICEGFVILQRDMKVLNRISLSLTIDRPFPAVQPVHPKSLSSFLVNMSKTTTMAMQRIRQKITPRTDGCVSVFFFIGQRKTKDILQPCVCIIILIILWLYMHNKCTKMCSFTQGWAYLLPLRLLSFFECMNAIFFSNINNPFWM